RPGTPSSRTCPLVSRPVSRPSMRYFCPMTTRPISLCSGAIHWFDSLTWFVSSCVDIILRILPVVVGYSDNVLQFMFDKRKTAARHREKQNMEDNAPSAPFPWLFLVPVQESIRRETGGSPAL